MTAEQFEAFKAELRAFLLARRVMLAPSQYDMIDVWDLKPGDDPIYQDWIRNRTDAPSL